MILPKARVRLCAWLVLGPLIPAQAQDVTDTKLVNGEHGGKESLRKINGRWWSQDNREVYPPGNGGIFWVLDSKPGVVQFFHHRPFQLGRAESLRLWMSEDEVKAALGPPNRIFGTDSHCFWYYYAADGTKVSVRFMGDGVGQATYTAVGEKSWPVASIERELDGRDVYKLLQEHALKRSQEWLAKKTEENRVEQAARSEALRKSMRPAGSSITSRTMRPSVVAVQSVPVPRADSEPVAQKRIVSAEALSAIALGTSRDDLLSRLGEPNSRFAITSDEGTRESLTYDLDNGETVVIRLLDGKVVKVR